LTLGQSDPNPDVPAERELLDKVASKLIDDGLSELRGEFLNKVASRLFDDGFSVQRNLQIGPYNLDVFATRPREQTVYLDVKVPWFDIAAVTYMEMTSPSAVQDYLSYVSKYIVKNRHALGLRINGLITIAAIVSQRLGDETKLWISETPPPYSEWWARLGFPVLVELTDQQIFYYRKPRGRPEQLCNRARTLSDKWFSFQSI